MLFSALNFCERTVGVLWFGVMDVSCRFERSFWLSPEFDPMTRGSSAKEMVWTITLPSTRSWR